MEAFPPKDYTNTEVFLKDQWSYGSQNASYSDAVSLINELKSGPPELLNDLNELSAAIGDNPNFSTDIIAGLAGCVKNTGNETISGNKIFSGSTTFTNSINTTGSTLTIGDADSDTFAVNSFAWLKNDIKLGDVETEDVLNNFCRSTHHGRALFRDNMYGWAGETDVYSVAGVYLGTSTSGHAIFGSTNTTVALGEFRFVQFDKDGNSLAMPLRIMGSNQLSKVVTTTPLWCQDGLEVSAGTVTLPNDSVSQSAINGLTVDLTSITDNLLTKAADNAVLHLTGDESIDGVKTFNAKTYFGESVIIGYSVPFTPDDAGKLYCRQGLDVIQGANFGGSVNCGGGLTASTLNVSNTLILPTRSVGDGALSANVPLKNADNVWSGANGFSELSLAQDATFTMSTGSTLSLLNSSIADSALTANIPKKNSNNVFTQQNGFSNLTLSANGSFNMSSGSTLNLLDNSIALSKVAGASAFVQTSNSNTFSAGTTQKFDGTLTDFCRFKGGHLEQMFVNLGTSPPPGQESGEFEEVCRFTTDRSATTENFLNNLTITNDLTVVGTIYTAYIESQTKLQVNAGLNLRTNETTASDLTGARLVESESLEVQDILFSGNINSVSATEVNYLSGTTSNIQAQIDNKANTNNAALTGVPTCPTAISSTNSTQIASTAFVKGQISDLLGGAGPSIDTLLELNTVLAQADSDLSASLTALIATKANASAISNIDNTSDLDKPISTASQAALDLKANASTISNIDNTSDLDKPISTATQTALDLKADTSAISNIDNTSDLDKPISSATQTALDLKADASAISNIDNTSDLNKPISTDTQAALDLKADATAISNIDNTSDLNKPISTDTQAALDLKADASAISNIDNTSDLNKPISTDTQAALDLKADTSAISNIENTSDLDKPISSATQTALDLKADTSALSSIISDIDAIQSVDTAQQTAIDDRLIKSSGGVVSGDFSARSITSAMEKLNTVLVSGSNTCAINYSSGSVWYVTPDSATNFEASCTNVNPASSTTVTNTITLIINNSTHECFANTLRVNGTVRTLTFASGAVDITGAAQVVQNISIIYSGSSGVPVACLSSVVPYSALA